MLTLAIQVYLKDGDLHSFTFLKGATLKELARILEEKDEGQCPFFWEFGEGFDKWKLPLDTSISQVVGELSAPLDEDDEEPGVLAEMWPKFSLTPEEKDLAKRYLKDQTPKFFKNTFKTGRSGDIPPVPQATCEDHFLVALALWEMLGRQGAFTFTSQEYPDPNIKHVTFPRHLQQPGTSHPCLSQKGWSFVWMVSPFPFQETNIGANFFIFILRT